MIRGVLLDLDGVIYDGDQPIAGAASAVSEVMRAGVPVLFVTNTTSCPASALARKLRRFGVTSTTEFLTPPVAAAQWIRDRGDGRAALFVPEATLGDFRGLTADPGSEGPEVRYVVVGDLGREWDYATLNRAFRLLHADPCRELVALGLTRYWQSAEGANLDVGPFVAALECATGRTATVVGKPSGSFFREACRRLGLPPGNVLMVGDDIQADSLGAMRAGLRSVLVRTGKFRPSDLQSAEQPDWVLDSVRDLPRLLADYRE